VKIRPFAGGEVAFPSESDGACRTDEFGIGQREPVGDL
jgi:hypothetical protein